MAKAYAAALEDFEKPGNASPPSVIAEVISKAIKTSPARDMLLGNWLNKAYLPEIGSAIVGLIAQLCEWLIIWEIRKRPESVSNYPQRRHYLELLSRYA